MLILILSVLFELGLYYFAPFWRARLLTSAVIMALIGFWTGINLFENAGLSFVLLTTVNVFRVFNLTRIAYGRMHEHYLRQAARRSGLILILALGLTWLVGLTVDHSSWLTVLAYAQVVVALSLVLITARNLYKTRHRKPAHHYSDKELPTVTIAIPARNETEMLTSCLTSVVASDYPKLEILVLDDCSQDRTSEVIKAFAQDGVRFVKGHEPKERWLAKNQAYEQLSEAASGEFILFAGVDVRFGPTAVRALVTSALNNKRHMISVLPLRVKGGFQTAIIQPMRYWWELALPRRLFNRPPVLSTCWLIKSSALKQLGAFKAVCHAIMPEGVFARELIKEDLYSFIRADEELEIRTVKNRNAQLDTAVRMRYPELRRRPENVLLLLMLEILFLLSPVLLFVSGLWSAFGVVQWLGLVATLLLVINHVVIVTLTNPANSLVAVFNLPIVLLTEVVITLVSMYRYEFGTILWKDRNVCIPVMHIIPKKQFVTIAGSE